MQGMEAVKRIAELENISRQSASKKLGLSQNYISNTTSRGSSPRIDVYARILNAFGWELRAVKRGTADGVGFRID